MDIKPRQPMVKVILPIDHGRCVPVNMSTPDHGAYGLTPFPAFEVCEKPSKRVVRKEFFESGLSQHGAPIIAAIVKGRLR